MHLLTAQLCQIHDWTLNDAPPQPGLRTIRHGDTVLINGDDESAAPFIGVVHQVRVAPPASLPRGSWPLPLQTCYNDVLVG